LIAEPAVDLDPFVVPDDASSDGFEVGRTRPDVSTFVQAREAQVPPRQGGTIWGGPPPEEPVGVGLAPAESEGDGIEPPRPTAPVALAPALQPQFDLAALSPESHSAAHRHPSGGKRKRKQHRTGAVTPAPAPQATFGDDLPEDEGRPRVIQLGEIHGKAGVQTVENLRIPCSTEEGATLQGKVTCAVPGLGVAEVRRSGKTFVTVKMTVDAPRSFDAKFQLTVQAGGGTSTDCEGRLIVARRDPALVTVQAACGSRATVEVPVQEEFWAKKTYTAYFEPRVGEFWLSQSKGVIEAGAKTFPFQVFFAPQLPRPVDALLVIDCGDAEFTVRVCGSTKG
jgi:hypothetical protein